MSSSFDISALAKLSDIRLMRSKSFEVTGDTATRVSLFGNVEVWKAIPGWGRGEAQWFRREKQNQEEG